MRVKALTNVVTEIPNVRVVIELQNGKMLTTTGFVVLQDTRGNPTVVIRAGKNAPK